MGEFSGEVLREGVKKEGDIGNWVKKANENAVLKENNIRVYDKRMYNLWRNSAFVLLLFAVIFGYLFFHYVNEGKFISTVNQEVNPTFNQSNNYQFNPSTSNQYTFNPTSLNNFTIVINNYLNST